MDQIIGFLQHLMDADWILKNGGLYLVAFIIFAETGLFIGFFLPGDSLLFISGIIVANAKMNNPISQGPIDLMFWIVLIAICGIIGNAVGYWFGKKSGPLLYQRKDSLLFKRKYLMQAHEFYEKRGGGAIILARFLPVVRTFAPIVAGLVKMNYKKFFFYNVVGSITWVSSMMIAGYALGENEWVKEHLEYIIIGLVLVTTAPVLIKMITGKKKEYSKEEIDAYFDTLAKD